MNGQPRYSREELKKFVKNFYNSTGKIPRQKDFLHDRSKPSCKQFIDEWGSWTNMLIDVGLITEAKRPVNKNEHICQCCGRVFKAYGKRKYCSVECKIEGQRKYESLANSSPSSYRRVAFKNYDWKCCVCGYEDFKDLQYTKGHNSFKYPVILDVHHIDGDRTNNDVNNLCIVCPTCHAKIHRGIISVKRDKLFKKIHYEYNPVFGGNQEPPNKVYEIL